MNSSPDKILLVAIILLAISNTLLLGALAAWTGFMVIWSPASLMIILIAVCTYNLTRRRS